MKKMLSIYHATIEFDPTSPRLCHYHTTYFLWSIIGHGIGLRIVRGWPMSTTLPPINNPSTTILLHHTHVPQKLKSKDGNVLLIYHW